MIVENRSNKPAEKSQATMTGTKAMYKRQTEKVCKYHSFDSSKRSDPYVKRKLIAKDLDVFGKYLLFDLGPDGILAPKAR